MMKPRSKRCAGSSCADPCSDGVDVRRLGFGGNDVIQNARLFSMTEALNGLQM